MKLFLVPPLLDTWVHPTVHPHSLAVDAYLRMVHAPCDRVSMTNPGLSPTGDESPLLCINGGIGIAGLEDNLSELQKMGYVLEKDEELSPLQKVECSSLTSLIVEKLFKCQLFDLWMEVENYETFTKVCYSQPTSFPLRWWLDNERKKNMQEYLKLSGFDEVEKVKKTAKSIYEALSIRLGDEHFFFGDHPTTFDCIIFGFLQTQACKDIPKSHIQEYLFAHKNLVDFCNRITENWYMSEEAEEKGLLRNNLDYKPLISYSKKKEEKGMHEQEKKSSYIILGGLAVIFIYATFYQNSGK